jgi:hypothetical protein
MSAKIFFNIPSFYQEKKGILIDSGCPDGLVATALVSVKLLWDEALSNQDFHGLTGAAIPICITGRYRLQSIRA